jgi:hypothetical protein
MRRRYQVFVSSTLRDLVEERRRVWETLISFDYIVSGMETFPAASEAQFEYIKRQIDNTDYYILVLAGRYGELTPEGISFTEQEFDYAQANKIPILVFPIKDPGSVSVSKTDQDDAKMGLLRGFRTKAMKNRLCHLWDTPDNLCLGIVKALQNAALSDPGPGWIRGEGPGSESLLAEINELRKRNEVLNRKLETKTSDHGGFNSESMERSLKITFKKNSKAKAETIDLTAKDIINEYELSETPNEDNIEECLKGAISRKLGYKYDPIQIEMEHEERALLLLNALGIVGMEKNLGRLRFINGKNWAAAHAVAKLG